MEFKIRLVKTRKARKARNRGNAGFKRVKIRGRKRWVRSPQAAAEKKD